MLVDRRNYSVVRGGEGKAIGPRAFDVLVDLLDHAGRVVEKAELIERVWQGAAVTDNALTRAIREIREAIGDAAGKPRYVETVARRGYRVIAPVRCIVAQARTMVAVLPFADLSRAPEDFFCDGLTEELITQIARINTERLGVVARTSAMAYKATRKSAGAIARELGVDYLIEGSVRREGGRVRISAQLIDARDERHVWADSYEERVGDLLRIQARTAEAVARAIRIELPAAGGWTREPGPIDPDAYTAYLRGRYLWNRRTAASTREAIVEFQRATEGAPAFAPAHAGLARSCASYFVGVLPRRVAEPMARAAAARALELDDRLAEGYAVLAGLESIDGHPSEAERLFRRALMLDPNDASIHHQFAMLCLVVQGRFDQALDELRAAQTLDPLALIVSSDVAVVHYCRRDAARALDQCRQVQRLDPTFARAHVYAGWVHAFVGALDEAVEEFEAARRFDDSPWTTGWLGYGYGRAGRVQEAGQVLGELRELASLGQEVAFYEAAVHLGLDDREQSLACLDRARGERALAFEAARYLPMFDEIRGDPRFERVLPPIPRGAPEDRAAAPMPPSAKAAVERYVAATNARQPVDAYFAPGYRYHGPAGTLDKEAFLRRHDAFLAAFPDARLTILDVVSEGDRTSTRWCAEGTHRGELMGAPPTGRRVRMTGIIVSRFVDGLVVEEWEEMDMLGLMRQLGAP